MIIHETCGLPVELCECPNAEVIYNSELDVFENRTIARLNGPYWHREDKAQGEIEIDYPRLHAKLMARFGQLAGIANRVAAAAQGCFPNGMDRNCLREDMLYRAIEEFDKWKASL